jgi:hypothetical protein
MRKYEGSMEDYKGLEEIKLLFVDDISAAFSVLLED